MTISDATPDGELPEVPKRKVVATDRPMCSHVFPVLYLNMGVEMMYVLDSRLRVQNDSIDDREKSDKVVKELILGLLAKNTLVDVFKGYGIPTRTGLRKFFEKVAHCSIMRLNENSMDKLFDLITMSFKYALIKITMPEQIMTVTVNHLRALLDLVPLDKEIGAAVEQVYTELISFYEPLGPMGWFMVRNTLLVFFQDTRIKVSSLVRNSQQTVNGKFIIFDKNTPIQLMEGGVPVGSTKYFNTDGSLSHQTDFHTPYKYVAYEKFPDSLDAPRRSTDLGFNTYKSGNGFHIQGGAIGKPPVGYKEGNEMAFFEALMNTTTTSNVEDSQVWQMSLFDNDQDEKDYLKESENASKVVKIDASKKKKSLKSAMDDMKIDKNRPATAAKPKKSKGASMLDMMDEAAARPATAKKTAKRSESIGTPTAKPRTRSGSRPVTGERATSAAPKRAASAKRKPA